MQIQPRELSVSLRLFFFLFVTLLPLSQYIVMKALSSPRKGVVLMMNEAQLRQLIFQSPDKGYRELFSQYHRYVFTIVCRTLGGSVSAKDAEDCVADVFADVIMHFDTAAEGSLQGYIAAAARNKAITLKRSLSPGDWYTVPEEELMSIPAQGADVEEAVENSHRLNLVLDCIDALGEPDSTIIIQHCIFGWNSKEIARELSMTPAAVRMRMSRGMKKLRKQLEKLDVTL